MSGVSKQKPFGYEILILMVAPKKQNKTKNLIVFKSYISSFLCGIFYKQPTQFQKESR